MRKPKVPRAAMVSLANLGSYPYLLILELATVAMAVASATDEPEMAEKTCTGQYGCQGQTSWHAAKPPIEGLIEPVDHTGLGCKFSH